MITWLIIAAWILVIGFFGVRYLRDRWRKVPEPSFSNQSCVRILKDSNELREAALQALKTEYEIHDLYGAAFERRTKRYLNYLLDK
jgi:hypothetical protein